MCEKNFAFWCCALLLLVSSLSKSQEKSTNNEEKDDNLTVRYELDMNSTTNYGDEIKTLDMYEKFINNTQYDEMQYESHTTSMSNNREDDDSIQYKLDKHSIQNHEDDEQIPMKSHANSTNVSHQRNFTSQEVYGNLIEKNGSMEHEYFKNSSEDSNKSNIVPYEKCDNITRIPLCCSLGDRLDDDQCIPEKIKYSFPNVYGYTNDSFQSENKRVDELFPLVVYDPCKGKDRFLLPKGYQYDYKIFANGSLYLSYYEKFAKLSTYCLAVVDGDKFEATFCSETSDIEVIYLSSLIVSILLLVPIFLVYSILPELRNVHGFMLRNYSGALFVADIFNVVRIIKADDVEDSVCITIGFGAYMLYYYGLKSVCIISSICLSISTALKIARYERDTGLRLTDSESKRYNDNKKWFNLYMKLFIALFIVMSINWSIMTVIYISGYIYFLVISIYVWYAIDLMDTMQKIYTFIIFVWKKKIKRMLLKRFDCGLFPEARFETNVTSSTCTTTSEVQMQEKMSSCRQENHQVKGSSVGTEL